MLPTAIYWYQWAKLINSLSYHQQWPVEPPWRFLLYVSSAHAWWFQWTVCRGHLLARHVALGFESFESFGLTKYNHSRMPDSLSLLITSFTICDVNSSMPTSLRTGYTFSRFLEATSSREFAVCPRVLVRMLSSVPQVCELRLNNLFLICSDIPAPLINHPQSLGPQVLPHLQLMWA